MTEAEKISRVFKTRWFSKAAKKALIKDEELCEAIAEVVKGQADDLGGGVFKKRLNRNMHRSIVLARGDKIWVFAYLFAKKDRNNIDEEELRAFRALASLLSKKSEGELDKEVAAKELVEMCHGQKAKI